MLGISLQAASRGNLRRCPQSHHIGYLHQTSNYQLCLESVLKEIDRMAAVHRSPAQILPAKSPGFWTTGAYVKVASIPQHEALMNSPMSPLLYRSRGCGKKVLPGLYT